MILQRELALLRSRPDERSGSRIANWSAEDETEVIWLFFHKA
jgi:hypothetical protein